MEELDSAVRDDWGCACSAAGELMMENLLFDGYANGLTANIKRQKRRENPKPTLYQIAYLLGASLKSLN